MITRANLRFLGPAWFAIVLGWAGVALAWLRAEALMGGAAAVIGWVAAAIAGLAFVVVLAGLLLRHRWHPLALGEDLRHPVRQPFVAALPVSMLLLAALAGAALGPTIDGAARAFLAPFAATAVALQWAVVVFVLSSYLRHGVQWSAVTPLLFLPVVGNVVIPIAVLPLGWHAVAWISLGIGVFFWPVFTVMLLLRTAHSALPERLIVGWFILIAPPAVIGTGLLSMLAPEAGAGAGLAAFGVGGVFLAAVAPLVARLGRSEFGIAWWAMAFPLAALASLALRLAAGGVSALRLPALALLALASVVVVYLSLATIRGLRAQRLLVPETVPITSSPS